MNYVPNLGEAPAADARRDAVHVAVAPVVAGEALSPGDHVGIEKGKAYILPLSAHIGIVDPFRQIPVEEGDRFWLFLYPNTVTSLRHVWTHPAFVVGKETP